ncbi:hypothetical protein TrCOL_g12430 [Triparma columacea]|uniref:Uncharacterized protein n=1 Tax=Triparma columacea TaxID=722753 RepID=A0A9W7GDL4_9STRA|nr:hypothetical protein TrCOL_g12430 [Triparma columacea]
MSASELYFEPLSQLQSRSLPVTKEDMEQAYNSVINTIGPSSELEKVHAATLAQYDTACIGAIKAAKSLIQSALPEMLVEFGPSLNNKENFLNHVGAKFDEETKGWKGSGNNKGVESSKVTARKACLKKAGVAYDKAKVRAKKGLTLTGMEVEAATTEIGKKKNNKKRKSKGGEGLIEGGEAQQEQVEQQEQQEQPNAKARKTKAKSTPAKSTPAKAAPTQAKSNPKSNGKSSKKKNALAEARREAEERAKKAADKRAAKKKG